MRTPDRHRANPSRRVGLARTGGPDRVAGMALAATGCVAGFLATDFQVRFITDPVGPRALPLLAAGLLLLGGATMAWRPETRASPAPGASPGAVGAPDGLQAAPPEGRDASAVPGALRPLLAVAAMALVPLLFPELGFVLSVGLALAVIARLAGGSALESAAAALGLSGGLYLLFVYVLGVPLPVGRLFLAGGG